jgi:Helix-turn-helix domain
MSSKTYTPEDLAAISGFTVPTIMRWIRKKKLPARRTRGYTIAAENVREFLILQAANPKVHSRKTVNS